MTNDQLMHVITFLGGGFSLTVIAHAVNTLPVPDNKWGRWFIGVIQYIVGQRIAGANTLAGSNSMIIAIPKDKEQPKEVQQ